MNSLYLDDLRATPNGFNIRVNTVAEAKAALIKNNIKYASLDHDLGDFEPTGYDLCCWIEEQAFLGNLKKVICIVHSANPSGAQKMRIALLNANKHWAMWAFDPVI